MRSLDIITSHIFILILLTKGGGVAFVDPYQDPYE